MGMFDYVKVPSLECPECGEDMDASEDNFQTKDMECVLEVVDWEETDRFYGNCTSCKKWIEYERVQPYPIPFKNFKYIKDDA